MLKDIERLDARVIALEAVISAVAQLSIHVDYLRGDMVKLSARQSAHDTVHADLATAKDEARTAVVVITKVLGFGMGFITLVFGAVHVWSLFNG